MRPTHVFILTGLLCFLTLVIHLAMFYSSRPGTSHSHSDRLLNILKNSKFLKNSKSIQNQSVHDKAAIPSTRPPFPHLNVSRSFRKSIPHNGGYWNRLFNHAMRRLEKGDYVLSENDDNCRADREVLRHNVNDFALYPAMHREFLANMKCRHPPLLIDQPNKCAAGKGGNGANSSFLVFAINSPIRNFEQRQAVRETWGREGVYGAGLSVRRLFLLGAPSTDDPDLDRLLAYEAMVFGDVLQWDLRDSLFNLSLKEHVFYHWMLNHCSKASFVFKGDDSVLVNTQGLATYLNGTQDHYIGYMITSASPIEDLQSEYYIPQTLYQGKYPPYMSGVGYLFSGTLLRPLYYISHVIPFFPIKDVYTGMCFQALGIPPVHHDGFQQYDGENICAGIDVLTVDQISPRQMKRLWKELLTC